MNIKYFLFVVMILSVSNVNAADKIIYETKDSFSTESGMTFSLLDFKLDGVEIKNPYVIVIEEDGTQHVFNKPDEKSFSPEPYIVKLEINNDEPNAQLLTSGYLVHQYYCMGGTSSATACNVIYNSNGQEWDASWVSMDPKPTFWRYSKIYGMFQCVQTFQGCTGEDASKNGQCCMKRANFTETDNRYIDGNENLDNYEFLSASYNLYSNIGTCGCNQPIQNLSAGFIGNWVAGSVTAKSATGTDEYFINDNLGNNDFSAQQTYNIEKPVNADITGVDKTINNVNRFSTDYQETSGSCVVGNLENVLDYFSDADKEKNEWTLIQEGQFCGSADGSHDFCRYGTSEQEWTSGYNDYLDYCNLTNYRNDQGPLPSDLQIQQQINNNMPVNLGFRWSGGSGHAGTIIGYDYDGSNLYWFINDPIEGLQKYSDSWLDYHTQQTGFALIGFYNCTFPNNPPGSSPLFFKRIPSVKQPFFFLAELIGFLLVIVATIALILLNRKMNKSKIKKKMTKKRK